MGYVICEEGQKAGGEAAGSAPFSDALCQQALTAVVDITTG